VNKNQVKKQSLQLITKWPVFDLNLPHKERGISMKYFLLTFLILSMLTLGMAACNDDDNNADNKSGNVKLPGNGNTALSDVTSEDATAICMSIAEAQINMAPQLMEFSCQMAGVMGAGIVYSLGTTDGLTEICESAKEECMTDSEEEDASDLEADCADAADMVPDSCDATISELEGCINAINQATLEMIQASSQMMPACSDLTEDTLDTLISMYDGEEQPEPSTPAACDVIIEKCPELADEMDLVDNTNWNGDDTGDNSFQCADGQETIPMDFVCDGDEDCDDGSDEANCQ
jgi:hypothetical protein